MYLEGYHFVTLTDHLALKWLMAYGTGNAALLIRSAIQEGKVECAGGRSSRLIKEEAHGAEIEEDDWIKEKLRSILIACQRYKVSQQQLAGIC